MIATPPDGLSWAEWAERSAETVRASKCSQAANAADVFYIGLCERYGVEAAREAVRAIAQRAGRPGGADSKRIKDASLRGTFEMFVAHADRAHPARDRRRDVANCAAALAKWKDNKGRTVAAIARDIRRSVKAGQK